MLVNAVAVGTAYFLPKYLEERTNEETSHEEQSELERALKITKDELGTIMSPKTKFILWDVVAKNAWISILALCVLGAVAKNDRPVPLADKLAFVGCLCSTSWIVRFGVSEFLKNHAPKVAKMIAPSGSEKKTWLHGIPERFNNDPILRRYSCPITLGSIRNIVRDPNGIAYEKRALLFWLLSQGTSPITREVLDISDLRESPASQAIIDSRLAQLEDGGLDERN